ncbi:OprD family porin [Pseudomonas kuykendallii]|uniref:Outer membrane porin, OprD family n=1 Tax=Pseudomonas kuykendallii TaxID=1007099 RepID=A0A1H2R7A6_9PSED|nr:OprD family porin [Pseudomonas kuykendallii]MCQ4271576.1 OprD family porin [Pseudomonas kuykendallii]SDW15353.1 outer membrane porin, OprD family [Pseudomonas kuykendallii]
MKIQSLSAAIALGLLAQHATAAGFIEDSKASLGLRNFYYDLNTKNTADNRAEANEWGQGFIFNYASGFTEGTVGFGLDVVGLLGVKLDSGGNSQNGDSRRPGQLFPLESNGKAVDDFSKAGVTAKLRVSKTEARIGTLQPKLPVVNFNDGRLLPQLFDGGQVTSAEIDNLTLIAGQLEHTKTRASSNDVGLRIAGAASVGGVQADSNQFRYAGADYKVSKDLLLQYYYGNLEDFYKQHFLGLTHSWAIGPGALKTDLRYFHSDSDGKNGSVAGRAEGYRGQGEITAANTVSGTEVDNDTWSAFLTYTLGGHALSGGYQQISGDSAFPFLNQGDGSTAYLITDRQIGKFLSAGERTWLAEYSYDFAKLGAPGLKAFITYLSGDNIDAVGGDRQEWERDVRLDYTLQSGALKGLGFSWRNASLRGNTTANDQDENRFIVSYTLTLL